MEKTNWIEKIKEAVRIAMNKGLAISVCQGSKSYYFEIKDGFKFSISSNGITINTKKGHLFEKYSITDRDDLELRALVISIKEYREDMAISEFEEFISNKPSKPMDINDLDDKEDE